MVCLPAHTTHALQPCDVGAFGPLAQSWKRVVTLASQSLVSIRKDNLLSYYHTARSEALKSTTIQSAFRKTGIWPLNRHAIPLSAFEPSKNTTTQAAQPLPAHLPSILVPTPTQTPNPTPSPSFTTAGDILPAEESLDDDEEPMERYHIEVPPPLPGTSSRQVLRAENMMLRDIITQASISLEEDYAQIKLMDLENERLRKRAFEKENRKQSKQTSARARHMTAVEMLDSLALQDWKGWMKNVFKEAAPQFKVIRKNIADYHKAAEKRKAADERNKKRAAAAAAREERARSRGRGTRGGRRGGGRGTRGRGGAAVRNPGADTDDSESSEPSEPSGSSSSSESESEAEIPMPRSRRQRPVRVIRGHDREATGEANQDTAEDDEGNEHTEPSQPRPCPCPRPRVRRHSQDIEASGDAAQRENEWGASRGNEREHNMGAEIGIVPLTGATEGRLEAQDGGIEMRLALQSAEIENQVGPSRRRNPRRGNPSGATNT